VRADSRRPLSSTSDSCAFDSEDADASLLAADAGKRQPAPRSLRANAEPDTPRLDPMLAFQSEMELAGPPAPRPPTPPAAPPTPPVASPSATAYASRPAPSPVTTRRRFAASHVAIVVLTIVTLGESAIIAIWWRTGAVHTAPDMGSLTVTSEPPAAPVAIDGVARGTTPFTTRLATGSHRIDVGHVDRVRTRTVNVIRGGDAAMLVELHPVVATPPVATGSIGVAPTLPLEAIAVTGAKPSGPGWLAISSRVPAQVLLDGSLIGNTDDARIAIAAGRHTLELTNPALDYRVQRSVTIVPGQTTSVALVTPLGTVSIDAEPWAEVWIDGKSAGGTPIGNLSLRIGSYDAVFRHPELGEQRRTIVVGASGPSRVSVDLRR